MRAEKLARHEIQPSSDMKVRAAWLYYVEGLTQEQIAQTMNIGRIKVVRLLAAAREEGLVRIRIEAKGAEQIALERRLVRELGLGEAIVVPAAADEADTAMLVGQAAGSYLNDQVRDGMSIGIGWGATLHMSLKALGNGRYENLSVISLMGGLTHSRTINPSAVARRVADAFGAECYQLTAPIFVANETVRNLLWEEPGLKELLDRARRVDIALVSVGNVSEEATLFRQGLLPRSQLESLREAGAVGDVLCHFLDAEGNVVDHPFNRRIMAIDLEDIRRIPKVVVAAGGYSKVRAIRAALKATAASVLVTDEPAALGLLEG